MSSTGPLRVDLHSGEVSDPSAPAAKEKPAYTGGPSTFDVDRHGKASYIPGSYVQFMEPQKHDVTAREGEAKHFLDSGRSPMGVAVARHALTENDLIMHEGVESKVSDLVNLGILRKSANGGYEEAPRVDIKPQQDDYKPAKLDNDSETSIRSAARVLGDETILGLATTLAKDGEAKNLGDLASRLQCEPTVLSAEVGRIERQVRAAADRALAEVNVNDPAEFVAWVRQNHEGDYLDAVAAFVYKSDPRPLQKLGRAYADDPRVQHQQASTDAGELSAKETAKVFKVLQDDSPIPTYQKSDGSIMVWPSGASDWMPLQTARKAGLIKISVR
jgi:hypothetical protein